jgi:glutaredoxin
VEEKFMKLRIPVLICLAAALAASAALAQTTLYRWVDKDGKVQYTDAPPPADAKGVSERRMGGGGPSSDEQVPYATQMAAKRNPVTLYTSSDCGDYCNDGKALLSKRGIPFSEKNAQASQEDQDALMKAAGSLSVPFLIVGEAKVRGFDESAWHAALDRAGYARTRLPGQPGPRSEDTTK